LLDITYLEPWALMEETALVADVFHEKVIGLSVSSTLPTDMLSVRALYLCVRHFKNNLRGLVQHPDVCRN
jgi:hypothetical protein